MCNSATLQVLRRCKGHRTWDLGHGTCHKANRINKNRGWQKSAKRLSGCNAESLRAIWGLNTFLILFLYLFLLLFPSAFLLLFLSLSLSLFLCLFFSDFLSLVSLSLCVRLGLWESLRGKEYGVILWHKFGPSSSPFFFSCFFFLLSS